MSGLTERSGAAARRRVRLAVRGTVQGVGFRPFVFRTARDNGLAGWVANAPAGVTIEAEGPAAGVAGFLDALRNPPSPASVAAVTVDDMACRGDAGFEIRASAEKGDRSASLLPDLATCDDCLSELFDPGDRRHRYPFINCTRCGPRTSIVEGLPYDRTRTTMRRFSMCATCRSEYEDPADRRFHAEPIACADCGPQLALWDAEGGVLAAEDAAIATAAAAIRDGRIVAVKGIGGFHLMVDARNGAAVRLLRARKHRAEKPLAVMFPSLAAVRDACDASDDEVALLTGSERPIVLLRRRPGRLSDAVAPGNPRLGAMLPYAPLHNLLLASLGFPIVATSGNRSDEPIVIDEHEALQRLAGIADLFLVHDRPIARPIDNSVARLVAGRPMLLRRARGYAPGLAVRRAMPPGILAVGGHLKSTVALTLGDGIVLSQHLGDLETREARAAHDRARDDLAALYGVEPSTIVRDLHPDYHSSRAADTAGLPVVTVQHHVAHVVACMAEHELAAPVLGVAWDGTGYGTDGTVWGGEFIVVDETGWRRAAHLRPFRLPGGEAAVREPRRAALGLLFAAFGAEALFMTDLEPVATFSEAERRVLGTMLARGVNAPLTTSAGRLFDGIAALLGLRQRTTFEGQAAADLEWADETTRAIGATANLPIERTSKSRSDFGRGAPEGEASAPPCYSFRVRDAVVAGEPLFVDWVPALLAILADRRAGTPVATISRAFHRGLAATIADVAARIGVPRVVLTGGCFQNAVLAEASIDALRAAGLTPYWHQRIPPNDGGLAVGQAMWAARPTVQAG